MLTRCAWVNLNDPLYIAYHDFEWGVPVHDDRLLFEYLILEGMQAGLSWSTILRKRENFRLAFDNFEPGIIAAYGDDKIEELMNNAGIIRNHRKILASIGNAQAFLAIQAEFGTFDAYIWQFIGGKPITNRWETISEIPAHTEDSDRLSKDLLLRGFKFVGSTIIYAHMQATGMVNDHTIDCFRHSEILNSI
ncbi:MAG: DNA-3-methyladenine glycosylase I [Geobacteraceae bacterium]|nr:MAG: DNA-3-methyladenine glycosylase I [Geobacteraceae bacterium]